MRRTLRRTLRPAPITVPCLAAAALLGWWAADEGGYSISRWAPGAAAVLVLLGIALVVIPNDWAGVPRPVRIATGALAAFTAWSFLSMLWAGDRGAAWEGSQRTLLYLALFALFALWPQRGRTAAMLLAGWVLVVQAVTLVLLLRMAAAGNPRSFFGDDRLVDPAGYPNATAALALMAFWPAVLLAAGRSVAWPLRAVLAGGAVALADVALMAQSRGGLLASGLTAAVVLALAPGRLRVAATLAIVLAGAAAAAPATLDVGDALNAAGNPSGAVTRAVQLILLAAVAAGTLAGILTRWESRSAPSEKTGRRVRRAAQITAGVAALTLVAGGVLAAGNPVDRVSSAYGSFKGGYESTDDSGSRLVGGLGSNRYDFYRVALREFRDHPVAGIGADNFRQAYLLRGASDETPRYPHSLELRTLAQTGLVGAVLLLGALGAAFAAAWRGMRAPGRGSASGELHRTVTAAAASVTVPWLIHGSADWFFEYAGLGAAAFAFLGLACALAPRAQAPRGRSLRLRRPAVVGLVGLLVVAAAGPVSLWMADGEIATAGQIFATRPAEALHRLDRAAVLNPFSAQPPSVAGSIALRFDESQRADRYFRQALGRVPDDAYATLERGAIASADGRRDDALVLLRRAVALAPRDPVAVEALQIARSGGRIDVRNLNRAILLRASDIG